MLCSECGIKVGDNERVCSNCRTTESKCCTNPDCPTIVVGSECKSCPTCKKEKLDFASLGVWESKYLEERFEANIVNALEMRQNWIDVAQHMGFSRDFARSTFEQRFTALTGVSTAVFKRWYNRVRKVLDHGINVEEIAHVVKAKGVRARIKPELVDKVLRESLPVIQLAVEEIKFGRLSAGKRKEKEKAHDIEVRNVGANTLEVDIWTRDNWIKIEPSHLQIDRRKRYVHVVPNPSLRYSAPRRLTGEIHFTSNGGNRRVAVSAEIRRASPLKNGSVKTILGSGAFLALLASGLVFGWNQVLRRINKPPSLDPISASTQKLRPGEKTRLEVHALDPDGDSTKLRYHWSDPKIGKISGEGYSVYYEAPGTEQEQESVQISVKVSDENGESSSTYINLSLVGSPDEKGTEGSHNNARIARPAGSNRTPGNRAEPNADKSASGRDLSTSRQLGLSWGYLQNFDCADRARTNDNQAVPLDPSIKSGLDNQDQRLTVPNEGVVLVNTARPKVPPTARTDIVEVAVTIGKNGRVTNLRCVSGPSRLQEPALEAARLWQFKVVDTGHPFNGCTVTITFYATQ